MTRWPVSATPPAQGQPAPSTSCAFRRFSLDSVERVSRAIRWATLVPRMLAYPPALQTIPEPELNRESWLGKRDDSRWAVVRMPRPGEMSQGEIERRLSKARDHLEDLKQKRGEIEDELRRVRDDRRRRSELNREKRNLLEPLRNAESCVERWEEFERDFEKACAGIAALSKCPACGEDAEFEAREHGCLAVRCRTDSCRGRWELRHDPDTKSRIPVFRPGDFDSIISGVRPTASAPQRVDEVFGCDALAIPIHRDDDGIEFLPPRTKPLDDALGRMIGIVDA